MPNPYDTTAMLISGNLKEGKNGDGITSIMVQRFFSSVGS